MKFEFNKKKTNDLIGDVVLVAAAAGAVAAGCVIAVYEALKSEKGQAGIAKVKTATVHAAGKVKETATAAAGKVKTTATAAVDAVKAKLPKKAATDECACDCDCEETCACEETAETAEEA